MTSFFYFFVVTDDKGNECLLLYSQAALLADFNSGLSGLNFVSFGLDNFTVKIDPTVLKPKLAYVLFFFTKLNMLSSDALVSKRHPILICQQKQIILKQSHH